MEPVVMQLIAMVVAVAVIVLFKVMPLGMMALATTKDTGGIGMGGGNTCYAREVTSAGADLGTPDTNHSVGHLDESSFSNKPDIVERFAEDGSLTFFGESKRRVALKLMFQQSDINFINMPDEVSGKYFRLYVKRGALQNGKIQEYIFGICRIIPQIELAFKDGEVTIIPCEVRAIKAATTITVANNTLPSEKVTVGAMDVPAGKYFKVVET